MAELCWYATRQVLIQGMCLNTEYSYRIPCLPTVLTCTITHAPLLSLQETNKEAPSTAWDIPLPATATHLVNTSNCKCPSSKGSLTTDP